MNILFVLMHPAPYRDPVINAFKNKHKDTSVVYLYGKDNGHLEWNYTDVEQIKVVHIPFLGDYHKGIIKMSNKYDAVFISGWYPITNLLLLIFSIFRKKKIILNCDTTKMKKSLFHLFIKKIIQKSNSFFVPGKKTKNFLINIGIKKERIYEGAYMLDQNNWVQQVLQQKDKTIPNIHDDDFVLLFVGKFVENRNIPLLINTLKLFNNEKKVKLILIGNGQFYKELIDSEKNNQNLIYIPEVEFNNLPKYYKRANCYIHPGEEPYSLATVQAAICGIPVVSNINVGCVDDYVQEKNGIIINGSNPIDYYNAIKKIIDNYSEYKKAATDISNQLLSVRNVDFACNQLEKAIFE